MAIFVFVIGHAFDLFVNCWIIMWRQNIKQSILSTGTLIISFLTTLLFITGLSIWSDTWRSDNGWNPKDKRLETADIFYSLASLLCFFSFTHVLRAFRKLGTMELSLTAMLEDVLYIAILVIYFFLPFVTAILKLYSFYAVSKKKIIP